MCYKSRCLCIKNKKVKDIIKHLNKNIQNNNVKDILQEIIHEFIDSPVL